MADIRTLLMEAQARITDALAQLASPAPVIAPAAPPPTGFQLGPSSVNELVGVHPDLVRVVRRAIQITLQDFTVYDGLRTAEEQRQHVASGASHTMDSKHIVQADGFGHAVDLVPWIAGKARWEWPAIYPIAKAMHAASRAEGVPLTWGGVWDRGLWDLDPERLEHEEQDYVARRKAAGGAVFVDGPHYQLRPA